MRVFTSFVMVSLCAKSLGSLSKVVLFFRDGGSNTLWLAVMAVDEIFNLFYKGYTLCDMWGTATRMSHSMYADVFLYMGAIDLPAFNVVAALAFPGFLKSKKFGFFHAFTLCCGGYVLPPAHALTMWLINSGPYM